MVATIERNTATWKVAVLLLLGSVLAFCALAKYSFAMPRSSPSHWVSKTCKFNDYRSRATGGKTILRMVGTVVRCERPQLCVMVSRETDRSRAPTPGFFRHASLRAPPTA